MSVYLSPHERLTYLLYVILINFSHHSRQDEPKTLTLSPVQCQPSDLLQVDLIQPQFPQVSSLLT